MSPKQIIFAVRQVTLLILLWPAADLVWRWWMDLFGPKPVTEAIHWTGDWTVAFLLATLALTPARALFGWQPFVSIRRRVGVATALYALLHLTLYALDQITKQAQTMLDTPDGRIACYAAGTGPTVLLLHSMNAAASSMEMEPLFTALAADHHVVAIDWLGFGASDRPDQPYRPERYLRVLDAVLQYQPVMFTRGETT